LKLSNSKEKVRPMADLFACFLIDSSLNVDETGILSLSVGKESY
jgi:hypothetical protein